MELEAYALLFHTWLLGLCFSAAVDRSSIPSCQVFWTLSNHVTLHVQFFCSSSFRLAHPHFSSTLLL